ncbi:MAG: RMD1 family protein, partial [Bacteroidetes bacterium]|nr:RMD1 family protein [Bacteroidota bacterium]
NYDESSQKSFIDEDKNEIILHNNHVFTKISMSHALAQSVKLQILERSVSNLLDATAPIQKELAQRGSVSLSKTEIAKQMGVLFSERYSINMHSDILDVPEFFWRRPSYEPLYLMTAEFHDITQRQNIMNHRLDMIHDLYSILSDELNARHSSRLEIIIIVLITIEVVIALIDKNFLSHISTWLGS